jgi:hypothetical protein
LLNEKSSVILNLPDLFNQIALAVNLPIKVTKNCPWTAIALTRYLTQISESRLRITSNHESSQSPANAHLSKPPLFAGYQDQFKIGSFGGGDAEIRTHIFVSYYGALYPH